MNTPLAPVHFTHLKLMARSPAHYRHAVGTPFEPTSTMLIGTLVHAYVLGSWKDIAVYDGTRRGKAWDDFKLEHAGKEIATKFEDATAQAIAESVLRCPDAVDLLLGPSVRREHEFRFFIGERECSVRLDSWQPFAVTELKTTHDANPATFHWHAARQGWLAQLAWQGDALEAAGFVRPGAPRTHYIVAAEQRAPYVVQVYQLDETAVDFGRRCWRLWWERLMVCESSNVWPGYAQSIQPLSGPPGADDVSLIVDGESVEL